MSLPVHIHWPAPWPVIVAILITGAALMVLSVVVRKRAIVAVAALWNLAIVFAFMSPHNRHILHLSTHRSSVIVNAAIGVLWLLGCVVAILQ